MTRRAARPRHLDTRTALDYLDQRLDARAREAVEAHLAAPCPACRERVRELGAVIATLRSDPGLEVPEPLTRRAIAVFEPRPRAGRARAALAALAELLFDSFATPQPGLATRSVGEARRLRWRVGEDVLELEFERDGDGRVTLRGRLEAAEPALWSLVVTAGEEQSVASPDARGLVLLAGLPLAPLTLRLQGPAGRYTFDPVEP